MTDPCENCNWYMFGFDYPPCHDTGKCKPKIDWENRQKEKYIIKIIISKEGIAE